MAPQTNLIVPLLNPSWLRARVEGLDPEKNGIEMLLVSLEAYSLVEQYIQNPLLGSLFSDFRSFGTF